MCTMFLVSDWLQRAAGAPAPLQCGSVSCAAAAFDRGYPLQPDRRGLTDITQFAHKRKGGYPPLQLMHVQR